MLRVGDAPAALYNLLPEALREFHRRYPGVVLQLVGSLSTAQEEALASGRIDVGFLYPPVEDNRIATEVVAEEPLVAVLPAGHRLVRRGRVALQELAGESFVMFPRRNRPTLHDRLVAECRRAGFSPQVAQEAEEIQALLGLVAAGFGVALTLASFQQLQRPGVAYRPLQHPAETLALAVAWRSADSSPALTNFLAVVRETAVTPADPRHCG